MASIEAGQQVRVRYAPSPTGHLHIGNARTALFNYLFAKKYNGKFVIRIEDTDLKRNIEGGVESQLKYLQWLGMSWDESVDVGGAYGPYRQTERLELYQRYADELVAQGKAYKCYCTEQELEAHRQTMDADGPKRGYPGTCRHYTAAERAEKEQNASFIRIRFAVDPSTTFGWNDMVKGRIDVPSAETSDFVIVKHDGIPTYNFAVVVDDHLMAISHVLRGEDHASNTPRQLMIYEALGWQPPQFAHMSLIIDESRKKLSKRNESIVQFIEQYEELGYLPETLFNFIALLGWSPEGERELFSQHELIEEFVPERLLKAPAMFDPRKLAWMNGEYIKQLDVATLTKLCVPYLERAGLLRAGEHSEQWLETLVGLLQEKLKAASDIVDVAALFFASEIVDEEEATMVLAQPETRPVLETFLTEMKAIELLTVDAVKAAIKNVQTSTGYKGKQLFMPIRAAVTGQTHGSDLNLSLVLIGAATINQRIQQRLAS